MVFVVLGCVEVAAFVFDTGCEEIIDDSRAESTHGVGGERRLFIVEYALDLDLFFWRETGFAMVKVVGEGFAQGLGFGGVALDEPLYDFARDVFACGFIVAVAPST